MNKLPEKIDKSIREFLDIVNNILGERAKKVILFGSYARGDFNESSDIDIMILTDLSDDDIVKYRDRILDLTYDIELKNNVILSPLIKNIDKFNYWIEALPFYMNVKKEGVILSESQNI